MDGSDSPVWLPLDTAPSPAHHHGDRSEDVPRQYYDTFNPRQPSSYSDIPPTSFKDQASGQGTWPRTGARPVTTSRTDEQSDGHHTNGGRGTSLHTISEHDSPYSNVPVGSRLQQGGSVNPASPDHDQSAVLDPSSHALLGSPPPSYSQSQQGPSMTNGMSTTVPQSMVQHNFNSSHQPTLRRQTRASSGITKLTKGAENIELRCCRITVLLVIMKIVLGATITALGFYMERLSSSITLRECPYWAGIPVLVAGILGLYYCATDFAAYSGSNRAFVIKVLCFVFSSISIFICMVAAIFPGLHGHRIPLYSHCEQNTSALACICHQQLDGGTYQRQYVYADILDCVSVRTSIKDYLILQCALNSIASGVCLWFVTLLWKQRYADFHAGLRFYTYSASIPPPVPWSDHTAGPPFRSHAKRASPVTVRKMSQRAPDSQANSRPNTLPRS